MFEAPQAHLQCRDRRLRLDRPRIAGIVNVTPDSFSDGGEHVDPESAVRHGLALVEAGADLLDIGGESTRPGAAPVDAATEIARVVPVITALAQATSVPISVDTSKPEVMHAAIAAGAHLINDVRALRLPGALDAAAELGVPVILMHMQGEPGSMQQDPRYADVLAEVRQFLADRVLACQFAGIDPKRIVVDPGFGFGKTLAHNLALLQGLRTLTTLGCPLLVGLSRKRMFAELLGISEPKARAHASSVAALLAVQRGALLVRTHDVAPVREALALWAAVGPEAAPKPAKSPLASLFDDD